MKKGSDRIVDISFWVYDKLYQANVYLNRPTAIVLPDQNIVACTNLGPKPDDSTRKNRYRKEIDLSDEMAAKVERKQKTPNTRTIYSHDRSLNTLSLIEYSAGEPFVCNHRHLVMATRLPANSK